MLFRRKGWLRNQYDQSLVEKLVVMKDEWSRQKQLIERSVEPSPEVLFELKLVEAKYLFLLREAKNRSIRIRR
ncbi:YaaL family protein [Metabacillus fastidiosus]|uniref:YaaL family protein n=1 Tax=Metabacillus fastidiosus TaxID=1458 RepID=A0ABU6P461_9BACI|nr:YaaL family protein [Metabacillus fastidiosus]MED4404134.1 YaaL family protein [Metabacillus fastidiosus]MED4455604.1 YaaL family protein [Metabacillus fastidiosus]MED4464685.1 YaaL family protein [Metabacillus fastidiosus]